VLLRIIKTFKHARCPSPDGSGYPFAGSYTSSVHYARVPQKIRAYSRFPASNKQSLIHLKEQYFYFQNQVLRKLKKTPRPSGTPLKEGNKKKGQTLKVYP
jgi:hypothetical protein